MAMKRNWDWAQACGETLDIMKNDLAAYYLFVEKKIIILKHFRISSENGKEILRNFHCETDTSPRMFPLEFSIFKREK